MLCRDRQERDSDGVLMYPFRIDPQGRADQYKTYEVAAPLETHWRKATCAEVECDAHLRGWATAIDVSTDLGKTQANYIRLHSGRKYTVTEVGTIVTFTFPSGQQCFRPHRVPLDRPGIFIVRSGDWRGNPDGFVRRHSNAEDWVNDFSEHQDKLKTTIERG